LGRGELLGAILLCEGTHCECECDARSCDAANDSLSLIGVHDLLLSGGLPPD
jgi:hypothetical protein